MPIDERARGFDQVNFNQTGSSCADAKSTFVTFLGGSLGMVALFRPKHQQSCWPTEIDLLSNQLACWL
jgi:hypothetical protein